MSEMAWPEPGSRPPDELLEGLYSDDEGLERRLAPLLEAHRNAVLAAERPPACSPDHHTRCGDIEIGDNQARDCLSLYQDVTGFDSFSSMTIHICDWPALKAAIDQHQRERGGRT